MPVLRWFVFVLLLAITADVARAADAPASQAVSDASAGALPGVASDGGDAGAAPAVAVPQGTSLRVALAGSKPFIVRDDTAPTGLAVDVWSAVAKQLGIGFELTLFDSVREAIDAVARGRVDVAVGPISITSERAERVDFTQPYYAASAGIMATAKPSSAWTRFQPVFSRAVLFGILTLIVVLFVVGSMIWLAERRSNPDHFPPSLGSGIGTGMWFALVTMTTVGFGDKVPLTRAGRGIASVWMLVALLAMSSVTAGIATALTLSQIETDGITDLASLRKRRVVVVDGTPAQKLVRRYRANVVTVASKERALEMAVAGKVDAMVYDYPILQYYLHENPELDLAVYESTVLSDNYGFAAARGSDLVPRMNIALLHLRESGEIQRIAGQWLHGQ